MKPNLLIILTDQLSKDFLGTYGGKLMTTPNIDELAEEGAKFNNFYTPSAVCTPSRGCMFTGRYPHINGAFKNDEVLNINEVTFAKILSLEGYVTGYAGKWHLNGRLSPGWLNKNNAMGFEECKYMFNSGHFKKIIEHKNGEIETIKAENSYMRETKYNFDFIGDEKTYTTDWLADKAIDFIEQERNNPFCYVVSFPDPHQPFCVREPYCNMYNPEDMTIPKSFYDKDLPDWANDDEWGRKRYFPMDLENREKILKKIKAQYCGEVKCIDDNVGKIIESLKKKNIFDDTIVVFITDHGEYMGEHGLLEKNNLYDSVYNISLIIRWPQKINSNTIVDHYVSMVDFQQTILGLMGCKPSGYEQGKDISSLLLGGELKYDEEIYIHPSDVPRGGIITREYELAYVGKGFNQPEGKKFKDHILFDRKNDPEQCNNLFNNPEYKDIIEKLRQKIVAHFKEVGVDKQYLPDELI